MTARTRLVAAVACGLVAAVATGLYLAGVRGEASSQRQEALERYGGETATVYVATRTIEAGEAFSDRNVELQTWLVDLLPEGALTQGTDLSEAVAATAVAANTPLSQTNIGVAAAELEVPEGLVALTVPASDATAVGGAVHGGDRVDLYAVGTGSAYLLANGVEVLQTSNEGTSGKLSWVTVGVASDQVAMVVTAAAGQSVYLVLPSEEAAAELAAFQEAQAALGDVGLEGAEVEAPTGDAPEGGDDGAADGWQEVDAA